MSSEVNAKGQLLRMKIVKDFITLMLITSWQFVLRSKGPHFPYTCTSAPVCFCRSSHFPKLKTKFWSFLCTPDKSDYWGEPTKCSRLETGQSSVVVWELGRATGQSTSLTQVYFYFQVYFSRRKKKKREVFLLALHIKKKNIINLGPFRIRSAKSIYSVGACVFKGERKYAVVRYYSVY